MKLNNKQVLLLIGGGLAFLFWQLKTAWDNIRFGLTGIKFNQITPDKVYLGVGIYMSNPTFVQFTLGNFVADVLFNGKKVGVINYPINRYLYKNSTNRFNLSLEIDYKLAGKELWDYITTPGQDLTNWKITFIGTIEINGKQVPINRDFLWEDYYEG